MLPPAWNSPDVATFNVSGIDHFREKYNNTESGNVTVTFAMDLSGIFFVEKAQFEVIVTDMVEIPRPKKKKTDDKKLKMNITIEETTAKANETTVDGNTEEEKAEKKDDDDDDEELEKDTEGEEKEEKKEEGGEKETVATDSELEKEEEKEGGKKEEDEEDKASEASSEKGRRRTSEKDEKKKKKKKRRRRGSVHSAISRAQAKVQARLARLRIREPDCSNDQLGNPFVQGKARKATREGPNETRNRSGEE